MTTIQVSPFFLKKSHLQLIAPVNATSINPESSEDSLFGCFYIMAYGIVEYEKNIHMMNRSHEKQLKFKCIEKLSASNVLHDQCASILGNNQYIDIPTFFELCKAYHISATYIHKNIYYTTESTHTPGNINLLCVHTNSTSRQNASRYTINQVPYDSIHWNDMYQVWSIGYPLPPISKIPKASIIQLLDKFANLQEILPNKLTTYSKKHIYECAERLLKLI